MTIDDQFERQTHIVVVEWCFFRMHGHAIVGRAGDVFDAETLHSLEQMYGLQIAAVHGMDAAGLESIGAGGGIGDGQHLDRIEVSPVG
jgi:hypothetical protein